MEKEWERNRKKNIKLHSNQNLREWTGNGMELEWTFFGRKVSGICDVNGKEMECNFFVKSSENKLEWNGMEVGWN